jgi:isoquinoline 1-oxidoreductase
MRIEPERYELFEEPPYAFDVSRRDFFGVTGAGLVVVCFLRDALAAPDRRREQGPTDVGAWLHIGEDGAVAVHTGKAEVGQDIRTSLAQAVAEELRAPVESIKLVMGDTALCPFDMGTFGSRSTLSMGPQLRRAAAAAREALVEMAARQLGVDRKDLAVAGGKVTHEGSKKSLGFGEITKGQKLVASLEGASLTRAADWKVMGASVPKAAGRDIVTGAHKYASDLKRPGMLYGRVLRPPSTGASLVSVDTSAVKGGVVRDGDFVGVAAPTLREADAALESVKAEWKPREMPSSKDIFDHLKKNAGRGRPDERGDVEKALREAAVTVERAYRIAYIAHAPLEPRAAVAEWEKDALTVWTGTQRPFGVRQELARAFGLREEQVRVIVPDTGSGYGGKHSGECAVEAARLAREAKKPVKLVWTRAEEFAFAYFRPAGVIEIRAGGKDGRLTAWEQIAINCGPSSLETPYDVPHRRTRFAQSASPYRQGSYRALASTANTFARECAMDELASGLKAEPLEFRLQHLRSDRLKAVLAAAAERFGWKGAKNAGLACGTDKGGYVATCAEVDGGRVARLVTAFECGAVVNPEGLKNQVEGAVLQGLGGALFEAIETDGSGRVTNGSFAKYRVPRFEDVPACEVVIVDRRDLEPAGGGETPIVAVAPAVANAFARATGKRFDSLPIRLT